MADYKESTVTGEIKTWKRARQITIDNSYGRIPSITFSEEEVTRLPNNKIINKQSSSVQQIFNAPNTEFNLINPTTGEVIGTAKHSDVYVLLHSLYMDLATKRDAKTIKR